MVNNRNGGNGEHNTTLTCTHPHTRAHMQTQPPTHPHPPAHTHTHTTHHMHTEHNTPQRHATDMHTDIWTTVVCAANLIAGKETGLRRLLCGHSGRRRREEELSHRLEAVEEELRRACRSNASLQRFGARCGCCYSVQKLSHNTFYVSPHFYMYFILYLLCTSFFLHIIPLLFFLIIIIIILLSVLFMFQRNAPNDLKRGKEWAKMVFWGFTSKFWLKISTQQDFEFFLPVFGHQLSPAAGSQAVLK